MTASIAHWLWRWLGAMFSAGEFVLKDDGAWGLKSDGTWALFNASNACDECCVGVQCHECIDCLNDLAADQLQLDLSAIANQDCAECTNINGTWFLPGTTFVGDPCAGGLPDAINVGCKWRLDTAVAACVTTVWIRTWNTSTDTVIVVSSCNGNALWYQASFLKNWFPAEPECCDITSVDIPFESEFGDHQAECDFTSAVAALSGV